MYSCQLIYVVEFGRLDNYVVNGLKPRVVTSRHP